MTSVSDVRRALRDRPIGAPAAPRLVNPRMSAVLLALSDGPRGAEVLLTRRSMEVGSHHGQVALPGGRSDADETVTETALREANEEVGLDPAVVRPFAELSHLDVPISNSYVVPVVAEVAGRPELAPTSVEVDRVFWVPLRDFTLDGVHRTETWGDGQTRRQLQFYDVAGETVWGVTGAIMHEFLALATDPISR